MVLLLLAVFIAGIVSVNSAEKPTRRNVGIIMHPDVTVFEQRDSRSFVSLLPLGSVVMWDEETHLSTGDVDKKSNLDLEWIHLSFPSAGYVLASAVNTVLTSSIMSWPMWRSVPELFPAGKGVIASKKLSLGWIDQWPVGSGGIGTKLTASIICCIKRTLDYCQTLTISSKFILQEPWLGAI